MSSPVTQNFNALLEESVVNFADVCSQVMGNFFGTNFEVGQKNLLNGGLQSKNRLIISAMFTGSVYGEYIVCIDPAFAYKILNIELQDPSNPTDAQREELQDAFREMLNLTVGRCLNFLSEKYDKLTLTAPKIFFGEISYPRVITGHVPLKTGQGQMDCYLYVDRMKLDIASSYKEALSSLTTAHDELKKAMVKLEEQQNLLVQSEKMAALGVMAAGVAHEVNTPLATVSLATGQMKEIVPMGDEELHRMLNLIEKTVMHISKITSGLGVFARGFNKEPFKKENFNSILEKSYLLSKNYIEEKNIQFQNLNQISDMQIEGAIGQLSQVLVILFKNSCDAVEDQPEKWIKFKTADLNTHWEIKIEDSGPGILEAVRAKCFDPFFTTKGFKKGMGLGLSVAKGIILGHKGSITIDPNSPNTCFIIKLPKNQTPIPSKVA